MERLDQPELKGRLHILVVDDNAKLADSCADVLRARGYSVEVSTNLSGAMAAVERQVPGLIFLDLVLFPVGHDVVSRAEYERLAGDVPVTSAFAFHRWLRSRADTVDVQVVFFSGRMQMTEVRSELQDGRTFYLAKGEAHLGQWADRILVDRFLEGEEKTLDFHLAEEPPFDG